VELRQLEIFIAVARRGSFSRAAEDLYLSQPALSQHVRRLEEELGVALLHRTSQGAELTPAGAELLPRAEAILADVRRARAVMHDHAGVARGVARVAAAAGDALRLPAILAAFHRDHPGIRIALRQASAGEVADLARRGAVDVAVAGLRDADAAGAPGAPGLVVTPLADEPLVVVAAPGDDLVAGGPVDASRLRTQPLILAERDSALRATVLAACQRAGFSPVGLFEVADPAAVRSLAHAGVGVGVVPASWLRPPGAAVGVTPLHGDPPPRYRLALLTPAAGGTPAGRVLEERLVAELGAGSGEQL
jgi:DNA-binding transcriptional LysR family regulator